jgi:hypothetical protein
MITCLTIGTAWVAIACAMGPKLGRALKKADPGEQYTPLEALDEFTVAQLELPPVPAPRSRLAAEPLVGAELDGQFYGIIAREFIL